MILERPNSKGRPAGWEVLRRVLSRLPDGRFPFGIAIRAKPAPVRRMPKILLTLLREGVKNETKKC